MEPLWDLCPHPLETCGPLPLPLLAGNLGPPSEVRFAGGDRRGAEASPVDVYVQHRRGRGCVSGSFLGLCNSFRVEEGRAKQATSLQGNPNDIGFTSLQGLGPHLLPDGHRGGEGFSDGALEEGNVVVGGDPLGHPQGHGQLALFGACSPSTPHR